MPQFIDSYYLVDTRESKIIYDFFEKYSFVKKELADDYPVPQYSNYPKIIFYSVEELFLFLESNLNCEYIIYLENEIGESEIKQITLQYTNDGKMIFGVSIVGNNPSSIRSVQLFKEFKYYLNSQISCITVEEPPPISSIEFVGFCNERYIPI